MIQVSAKSDTGIVRKKNEDSYFVGADAGLFIICDGMGGHSFGEVASRKTIEYAVEFFDNARRQRIMPTQANKDFTEVWSRLVVEMIKFSSDKLIAFSKSDPQMEGIATTITALLVVDDTAFVGHLGDSRVYLKRGQTAKQITNDHTLFEEFTRANPDWLDSNCDLDALSHFRHVLTRFVGRQRDFDVDTVSMPLEDNDVFLLCTDGLSNYFSNDSVVFEFLKEGDVANIADQLVEFANTEGGRDNITAVVLRFVEKKGLGEFSVAHPRSVNSVK